MLEFILFLLGIHLMMVLIAACYRILDLWYRIHDFAASIAVRILVPALIIVLLMFWLEGSHFRALAAGMAAFAIFHVAVFWLGQLIIVLRRSN